LGTRSLLCACEPLAQRLELTAASGAGGDTIVSATRASFRLAARRSFLTGLTHYKYPVQTII
jgi:hypothetical protein